jgi:hypothetical protein
MGSGSLNAMAVFEAGFKEDMTREEAMALVAAAIRRCARPRCRGRRRTARLAASPMRRPRAALTAPLPPPFPPPRSGVYNDLGSGSNVDLCVITKDDVDYLRNYEFLMGKTYTREFPVKYPKGTAREPPRAAPWARRAAGQPRRGLILSACRPAGAGFVGRLTRPLARRPHAPAPPRPLPPAPSCHQGTRHPAHRRGGHRGGRDGHQLSGGALAQRAPPPLM